jgi:diaminopimelate decarboxylase
VNLTGTMEINTKGHLMIGGCDTVELADRFGTPLYVVDEKYLRARCREFMDAFEHHCPGGGVIFAGKALLNQAICRIVDQEGLFLDVVSGGELYTALKSGFPAEKIFFHGNNKSPEEIRQGIEARIGYFVVDSLHELSLLNQMTQNGEKVNILLRINPGVSAHTHSYIRTGQRDSKFGFDLESGIAYQAVKEALECPGLNLQGFHCHIGSQVFEVQSYKAAAEIMMGLVKEVYQRFGFITQILDLGGGAGIRYTDQDTPQPAREYVEIISRTVEVEAQIHGLLKPGLFMEPGRYLVAEAGTTLYRVGAIKHIPEVRTYLAIDGGMADNPRVALYQAKYEAVLANKMSFPIEETVTLAGKCCESGDTLIWDLKIPKAQPEDIIAVFCTGAYNYTMSSNYNRLPRPAMVLVSEGSADIIVERESYEDLIRNDRIPERLKKD